MKAKEERHKESRTMIGTIVDIFHEEDTTSPSCRSRAGSTG
jgi:hypothetical protein